MFKLFALIFVVLTGSDHPTPFAGFEANQSFETEEVCKDSAKKLVQPSIDAVASNLGERGNVVGVQVACVKEGKDAAELREAFKEQEKKVNESLKPKGDDGSI